MTEHGVRHARTDANLLAGITAKWHGRPQSLRDFIGAMAWDADTIPSFDEVSFGLQRLVAAGYVTIERKPGQGLRLRATTKASQLGKQIGKGRVARGEIASRAEAALGLSRGGPEDRSLGRLPDLDREEWDRDVGLWTRNFWHWAKPWMALSRGLRWILRRLRPDDYR